MLRLFSNKNGDETTRKNLHPILLMSAIVLICAVLTYIIPAGNYERVMDEEIGQEIVNPDNFSYIERTPSTPIDVLMSLTRGLQAAADVIFFLLIIGGMFAIINGSGALNIGIANILKRLKGREILIIPIFMLFFGCGAAFCGNFEEFLVFVPLVLACCITIGYDSLTAVGIIFLAATAGYGGAITNAFTEGNAQQIAGLPLFSGMGLRVVLFICLEAASMIYVMWIATQVKKNPQLSGSFAFDQEFNKGKKINLENVPALTVRQTLVIVVFLAGIAFAVFGSVKQGFYVDELSAVFLLIGIIGGIVAGMRPREICEYFEKGCKDMLLPGLMIGLARAAMVLLENANVLDTILHTLAGLLNRFPSALMACGMFIFHEIFNVFVPSGSTQADVTMPLMVTIADKFDLSRQTAVLAYQLGDAFTNVLAPTGGEILAALAICKVPFGKWIKYLLPIFIIWWVIALCFLVYATNAGF
ncbi:MAG: YfcC family protein [Lachnospiraceae bacterium]|nr:YfcC family protein [Lachnospiraceae bacterium]